MILETLLFLAQATAPAQKGAQVFAATCSVGYCHGTDGAANRGPRLRGRTFEAGYVSGVVHNGIPNTAMPAFAGKLKDDDLNAVVAWVESIATITPKSATAVAPKSTHEMPPPIREIPAEFTHGRDLLFDATRNIRCGMCHQVDGRGKNAGPDLTGVAMVRNPALKLVRQVVLRDGESFPGLPAGEDAASVQVFDLTGAPPVLRTFPRDQIRSMEPASKWSHADIVAGYSDAELAEIGKYLAWLGRNE